jgi:hypothetical protein
VYLVVILKGKKIRTRFKKGKGRYSQEVLIKRGQERENLKLESGIPERYMDRLSCLIEFDEKFDETDEF